MSDLGRREFLAALGAISCGFRLKAEQRIRVGYAAITWGGEDTKAIDEISDVGFKGIQLRSSAFDTFGSRPAVLRDLLAKRGLTFAVL